MDQFLHRIFLLSALTGIIFLDSCKKDSHPQSTGSITGSVFGRVTDESGFGVYGATASAGGTSVMTDMNGIFILKNVTLDKDHAFVKVTKTGYFDGSRTFILSSNSTNNVEIKLLAKTLAGTFSSSTGTTINVPGNASLTFPANAIKKADGSSYSGIVNVYAKFLDPTDDDRFSKIPGDLIGKDSGDEEKLLQTFGMINVELEDASGNKLNLANGNEATLSMTIPSSLLSSAPSTIPLWYFDTNTGLWKEEGVATLTGNKYVGNVKHFSWWNCDVPAKSVTLTFRVVDANGNALKLQPLRLTNTYNGDSRVDMTDYNGNISGMVYANIPLKLDYLDNCNNWIFLRNIGPFTNNTEMGDITMIFDTAQTANYSGKIIDCSGAPVNYGYVKCSTNGNECYAHLDQDGHFSFQLNNCGGLLDLSFTAYDSHTIKQSLPVTTLFANGSHSLGNIPACDLVNDEYLQYQIDEGIPQLCLNMYASADSLIYISSNTAPTNLNITVSAINNSVRYFTIQDVSGTYFYTDFSGLTSVVTTLSPVGGYIDGFISGQFKDIHGEYTFHCSYHIKRE